MIAFFPEPYPDELAYSWFSRYHLQAGYPTHKAAMQDLYCKRSDTPSKEFIGNLNLEARAVIAKICPMRYFCMGNALVTQMITRMGAVLDTIIANEP